VSGERRHLVLVGLMGSGKTEVGRECARRLGRPFVDTDALVEARAGRSIADIFRHDGEDAFRLLERDAVAHACASPEPAVISCGGGAVLSEENRRVMRGEGTVVLLTAPVEVLAARVGAGEGRPLLGSAEPADVLACLAAERDDAYRAAAHVAVDTSGHDLVAVADDVLACLDEVDG